MLGLGLAGALAVAVSEFLTLFSVHVMIASCEDLAVPAQADACVTTGGEHHLYALLVLGAAIAAMTAGAALGRSRPAAMALVALGVAVLAIALALDLPDAFSTGAIGDQFESAKARPGVGFYTEIAGALLTLAAGVVVLVRLRAEEAAGERRGGGGRAGTDARRGRRRLRPR